VRVSVGATPQDLAREVLTGGLRLLVPGLALGLLCAGGAARAAQSLFVGVNVLDPLLYLAVAVVQAAVVVIACLAPALRAARVDPLNALRSR
jgi:putative ABC transport system permease protein